MKNRIIAIIIIVLLLGFGLIFNELTSKKGNEEIEVVKIHDTYLKKVKKKKKKKRKCPYMSVSASKKKIKKYAKKKVIEKWGEEHWEAFNLLIQHESGWNANSVNRSSCACGLFQFYPCSKGGKSYRTSYKSQITQGLDYIQSKYGSPKKAWKFWQKHHWY